MTDHGIVPVAPNRVRAVAALRGMTLSALAQAAGVSRSALSRALSARSARPELIQALAVALDVWPAMLTGGCPLPRVARNGVPS